MLLQDVPLKVGVAKVDRSPDVRTRQVPPTAPPRRGLTKAACYGVLLFLALGWVFHCQSPDHAFVRALSLMEGDSPARLEELRYRLLNLERVASFEGQASLLRAKLSIAAGQYTAALEQLSVADSYADMRLHALLIAGEALYRRGQFYEAGAAWTEALQLDPDNVDAHRWLGVAYFELGAVPETQSYLLRVAEIAPCDGRPHRVLGLIWRKLDEFHSAVNAYRESLRRDPDQPEADAVRFELADCLHQLNDDRAALKLLDECPLTSEALALEAACYYNLAESARAIELLDESLALEHGNLRAIGLRAKIALDSGDLAAAHRFAQRAVRLSPNHREALHILMAANLRLGKHDEAKKQERRLNALNRLVDEYHDLISTAARDPTDADIRHRLGLIASRLDYHEAAKSWLTAALRLDPTNRELAATVEKLNSPYTADQDAIGQ